MIRLSGRESSVSKKKKRPSLWEKLARRSQRKSSFTELPSFYSIISSYTIRPKSKFMVAVTIHRADEPCIIKITLKGPSYNDSKTCTVDPLSIECVEFDVPAINNGDYRIIARGLQGIIFAKSMMLSYQNSDPLGLIQLDKAIYHPGDLVQFRVIFIDENTCPAQVEKPIYITIIDNRRNRLHQWSDVELKKGVYSGQYQLPKEVLLGTWMINVTVDGKTFKNATFEIGTYVIPRFSVSLDTRNEVAKVDDVIEVTVISEYTYGKGVKGKAIVSVYQKKNRSSVKLTEKAIDVDGRGQVQFRIGQDLIVPPNTSDLSISATMEEALTGSTMEAYAAVHLRKHRFNFFPHNLPYDYEPGVLYTIKLIVTTLESLPVEDSENPVELIIDKHTEGRRERTILTSILDEDGLAIFQHTFSEGKEDYHNLTFQYMDCESGFHTVYRHYNNADDDDDADPDNYRNHPEIEVITKHPVVHRIVEVKVELKTKDTIPFFVYSIIANGKHLKTELVTLPEDTKDYIIEIHPTFEMKSNAFIFVHYITRNFVKYEGKSISFDNFENYIFFMSSAEANAGDQIALEVKTEPDSYVGILAVDQHVGSLNSGNNLNSKEIIEYLERYDNSHLFRKHEARCPGEDFGFTIITNATGREYTGDREFAVRSDDEERPKILKEITKTWFLEDIENFDAHSNVLRKIIPNNSTSWMITAFSLHPTKGIALFQHPFVIKTCRPFFISTNLPYSVKRGAEIPINVIVFNYMENDLIADITLDNDKDEYDFLEPDARSDSGSTRCKKTVAITANTGARVVFAIRPKRVGQMALKISALSPDAKDAVQKELLVEHEGICVFKKNNYNTKLRDGVVSFRNTIQLQIPANVVPNSEFIEVFVFDHVLGFTTTNIDNLVREPFGTGAENMVYFLYNILVLWHLGTIQELTTTLKQSALSFIEVGYKNELTNKLSDGSFSNGYIESVGSTWHTAYVMWSFHLAKKYIYVDSKILKEGLNFLERIQSPNGCFSEVSSDFGHIQMSDFGRTAFVLLAFLENSELATQYKKPIDRGFDFLVQNVKKTKDLYPLSMAAYALRLRKLDIAYDVIARLEAVARIDGDLKYWTAKKKTDTERDYVSDHDIEITCYILLTLSDMDRDNSVLPIVRWLISNQSRLYHGYGKSEENVACLWALNKFAEKHIDPNPKMTVQINVPGQVDPVENFSIDKKNSMLTQVCVLPKNTREITFSGNGTGTADLQISYRYNVLEGEKKTKL